MFSGFRVVGAGITRGLKEFGGVYMACNDFRFPMIIRSYTYGLVGTVVFFFYNMLLGF